MENLIKINVKIKKITDVLVKDSLSVFIVLLVNLFVGLIGYDVFAGGCRLEEVSPSKAFASDYLANEIRNKVIEIEKAMNARGQNLNVVMVARSGESLEKFDVITDNLNKTLQEQLDYLADRVSANRCEGERGAIAKQNNPKTCTKPLPPQLPKDLIVKDKLLYSHIGFFIKRNLVAEKNLTFEEKAKIPDWLYVVHLLAECDKSTNRYGASTILYETLDRFFWDTKVLDNNANARRAMIVVPTASMQENLFRVIHDETIGGLGLHEARYNVASTPFTLRGVEDRRLPPPSIYQLEDQNSNQWPLEVLATASEKPYGSVRNRMQAQDVLITKNYRPSLVWPRGLKEGAACSFARGPLGIWDATNLINCSNQVFKDQRIFQLITVNSLTDFLGRNQLLANVSGVSPSGMTVVEASREKIAQLDAAGKTIEKITNEAKGIQENKKKLGKP